MYTEKLESVSLVKGHSGFHHFKGYTSWRDYNSNGTFSSIISQ